MRTLTLMFALLAAAPVPALAQDEPAAEEEKDAPKYLLGEVGVRVDLPEDGWKSDHWSDWDFKATSDDGVVLVAWTSPYQVAIDEADLDGWTTTYTKQAETQGGVEPTVVSKATREVQGRTATDFELSMGTTQDIDLAMFASGFPVAGQDFHIAAVTRADRKDKAREVLDGVLERLEITSEPKELAWGGQVKAPGLDATLTDYWRPPLKDEIQSVLEVTKSLGIGSLRGCWVAIHPHPGGQTSVFTACQDTNHIFPIVDELTFPDQEAELRDAWLGGDQTADMMLLDDRVGFWWDTKVGTKQVEVAAIPNEKGLVKSIVWSPLEGEPAGKAATAARDTLTQATFSTPVPPDLGESLRYYLAYQPTSPVILGPAIGAVVIFLGILGLIIFGLRRQSARAREEMEAL